MGAINAMEDSGRRVNEDVAMEKREKTTNEEFPMQRKRFHVDMVLLKIKLHYVLTFGAASGVMLYIPIYGKQLGLTATAVGIVYTVQPFFVLFAKPAIGVLTDHVRNLRVVLMFLIVLEAITYFSILYIPPLPRPPVKNLSMKCDNGTSRFDFSPYNRTCLESFKNITCEFKFARCVDVCNHTCANFNHTKEEKSAMARISINFGQSVEFDYDRRNNTNFKVNYTNARSFALEYPCECGSFVWDATTCTPSLDECFLEKEEIGEKTIYSTRQFWLYIFLVSVSGACAAAVFTLSDTACYEILGEAKRDMFGNQRVWGTISWGVVNTLTGYLNEVASKGKGNIDYSPGFYLLLGLLSLDLLLLSCIRITKTNFTSTIFKDVSKLLSSSEILAFTVAVFLVGALTGSLWSYQFWYLQSLGASQLLLGLTITVQCLLAEVPFFYISGYLVRTFGHFYCLVATFIAYFFRYLLYFFLINPWYVLPIELLHGQTYATFYVTMASFANTRAPPGTEATVLGLFGGMYEGLGVAIGSLLSGIGFDRVGGHNTFLIASIISVVSGAIFLLVRCVLERTQKTTPEGTNRSAKFSVTHPTTVSIE